MSYFTAAVIIITLASIYWVVTDAGLFFYANVLPIIIAMLFSFDHFAYMLTQIWHFLVANSFCPWIMIFRGRSIGLISAEFMTGLIGFLDATDFSTLWTGLADMSCAVCELVGGPALGIALNVLWIVMSYKSLALTYSKIFNRKKSK